MLTQSSGKQFYLLDNCVRMKLRVLINLVLINLVLISYFSIFGKICNIHALY